MRSIEEVLEYISEQLKREEDYIEAKGLDGATCPGYCMASGAYTALHELKDFIESDE